MFKNFKVGTKILIGFGVVLLFTVALSAVVFTASLSSNNNLRRISDYSGFQITANTVMDYFGRAQASLNVVSIQSNQAEYAQAVDGYDKTKPLLDTLAASAVSIDALSEYATDLRAVTSGLDAWKDALDKLNASNTTLDGLREECVTVGAALSEKARDIYSAQLDNLRADISAGSVPAALSTREQRMRHAFGIALEAQELRRVMTRLLYNYTDEDAEDFASKVDALLKSLDQYIAESTQQKDRDIGSGVKDDLNAYKTLIESFAREADTRSDLAATARDGGEALMTNLETLLGKINGGIREENDAALARGGTSQVVVVVFALLAVLAGIAMTVIISRAVARPVALMVTAAAQLAEGNLTLGNLSYHAEDEIGELADSMRHMADTIKTLIDNFNRMGRSFQADGDIDARTDSAQFKGSYREVAESVNHMMDGLMAETISFIRCVQAFSNGDFTADLPALPGKKIIMNNAINDMRRNLQSVNREIQGLVQHMMDGALSKRLNAGAFSGDWAVLIGQLNRLTDAVSAPVAEIAEAMGQLSAGNFNRTINGAYKGDFLALKESVNTTITNIASYIDEIAGVLSQLSRNNLNQEITRAYVGSFSVIKDALNNIIDTFNGVMGDIASAAEQVAAGARSISESSMDMATGATRQASSVEELNAAMLTINENTTQNADDAKNAEALSGSSKQNASLGDGDMKRMLSAMEGIKDSSGKISKIIKVIEDIAFQTNLLALNAAVEAARAGEHGKGFAVVAEEVRTLASRSQSAAKETAQLIEESIERVNEGTHIADKTANTLKTILGDIDRIADIITRISASSREQAQGLSQTVQGLDQITGVVQNNSATSEEAASASEELSSQADVMRSLVSVFKMKARG